jgi:hypothetical protein
LQPFGLFAILKINMKRILTIFLMFWLPLFMQSAWAMSTRMALAETENSIGPQVSLDAASEPVPCHGSVAKTDVQPSTHHHHCAHCLACAISMASASFDSAPKLYLSDSTQENTSNLTAQYLSIHLPAAIKPPISA